MNAVAQRLTTLMTLTFLALSVGQAEPSGVLLLGLATVVVSVALLAYYVSAVVRPGEITIGYRARQHREVLNSMPEPGHPDTAGRPRPRAPGVRPAAA